jgi:hypothetical protein
MVIACTSKKIKLLNFTKQQGGVLKWLKQEQNINSLIILKSEQTPLIVF